MIQRSVQKFAEIYNSLLTVQLWVWARSNKMSKGIERIDSSMTKMMVWKAAIPDAITNPSTKGKLIVGTLSHEMCDIVEDKVRFVRDKERGQPCSMGASHGGP